MLECLARGVAVDGIPELHVGRDLERRQDSGHPVPDAFGVQIRAGGPNDIRLDLLAEDAVRHARHDRVGDVRMSVKAVLDLCWVDVLTATQDEVAAPPVEEEQAVDDPPEIAGPVPTVGAECRRVGFRVGVISDEQRSAADLDLAGGTVLYLRVGPGAANSYRGCRWRPSDVAGAGEESGHHCGCARAVGFGHAVADHEPRSGVRPLLRQSLEECGRPDGSAADDGAEARDVVSIYFRELEQAPSLGGHQPPSRDPVLRSRAEVLLGAPAPPRHVDELGGGADGGDRLGVEAGEVEQRQGGYLAGVGGRGAGGCLAQRDGLHPVELVAVGQHGALRPAGGAARKEDDERVVLLDGCARHGAAPAEPPGAGLVEIPSGGTARHPLETGEPLGVSHEELGGCEPDAVFELGAGPPAVEGDDHPAEGDDGPGDDDMLEAVGGRQRHPIALADPVLVAERHRGAGHHLGRLPEGDCRIAVDEVGAVGVAARPGQEECPQVGEAVQEDVVGGAEHLACRHLEGSARAHQFLSPLGREGRSRRPAKRRGWHQVASGSNWTRVTSPTSSNAARTRSPMDTSSGGMPTMLVVSLGPSSSSTTAIT